MASHANRETNWLEGEIICNTGKPSGVPPAKIDEMLQGALDALEQTRRLHEKTANPETKRMVKGILTSLHSSLIKLAPLGIHSVKRLERVPTP